ncbi:hypothetical protein GCM10010349_32840 [Streptomyces flavofungini]|nr:hypothetical protein GCM10010349_32840 [Streptomyces flavofungini]
MPIPHDPSASPHNFLPPGGADRLVGVVGTAPVHLGRGSRVPGIDECLLEAMTLPGARGAAIVDWTSGLALGSVGDSPNRDHEATAAETAEVARSAAEYRAFADVHDPFGSCTAADEAWGTDGTAAVEDTAADGTSRKGLPVEDLMLSTRNGFHVIRFVRTTFDSSVFLYLWLDRHTGNLALARMRLRDLSERLVLL